MGSPIRWTMAFLATIALLLLAEAAASKQIGLAGANWTASSGGAALAVPAVVPGDIYLDLLRAGKIADPYADSNDVKLRWVGSSNWTYSRSFQLQSPHKAGTTLLICEGLDTVASIWLNGRLVGTSENMFHRLEFNISEFVRRGENSIAVQFQPPGFYAKAKSEEFQERFHYAVPPDCTPAVQNGICHANFIRKTQSSFSWDWGPAFPTMGIWRDISLQTFSSCFVDRVAAVPVRQPDSWHLSVEVWIWCHSHTIGTVRVDMARIVNSSQSARLSAGKNHHLQTLRIPREQVDLWWPRGYGEQILYDLTATFKPSTGTTSTAHVQVGFRHVALVQQPLADGHRGLSFYFSVNDIPIFLKGTNWIPADSFLARVDEDRLSFLFNSVVEANMNSMRVWGGGVYESELFYQMADRLGIMLWQDVMFAVALYPANPPFLASVRRELDDQVNRLKSHPSIIIWAGNNENELGLRAGWFHTAGHQASFEQYRSDYLQLYNETVWAVVNKTDFDSRPFVMSSPSNGLQSLAEGGVAQSPGSTLYGDVHFYDYTNDAWAVETYPTVRCATEFGVQSLPTRDTLADVLRRPSADWEYFGDALNHRQHHTLGNVEMLAQTLDHFPLPACAEQPSRALVRRATSLAQLCPRTSLNSTTFMDAMVFLTQAVQAVAYQTEAEHYRRWRSQLNATTGEGRTMCSLYWQLNDIWQAPSWASIDYALRWKMAHYFARRFYAPLLVSQFVDGNDFKVFVVSDLLQPLSGANLLLDVFSFHEKFSPIFSTRFGLSAISPLSARILYQEPLDYIGVDRNSLVFRAVLQHDNGSRIGDEALLLPNHFHLSDLPLAGSVEVQSVTTAGAGQFAVSLRASGIAPLVWLECPAVRGHFTDNAFTMTRPQLTVRFHSWYRNASLATFNQHLRVTTLRDFYA